MKKYLNSENPFCREERQWAAILYMMLLERNNIVMEKVFGNEQKEIEITSVYYEATFMRDYFFAANSRIFNHELEKFFGLEDNVLGADNVGKLSLKKMKHVEEDNATKMLLAKYMMNSKPDIAIGYKFKGQSYLRLLECKNESEEGKYEDVSGSGVIPQTFIQELILRFLCGKRAGSLFNSKHMEGTFKSRKYKDIKKASYYQKLENIINQVDNQRGYFDCIENGGVKIITFCSVKNESEININKEVLYQYYEEKLSHTRSI